MDTPQPISVHLGPDKPPLVLLNGLRLNRLTRFTAQCTTKTLLCLKTAYEVIGCFPEQEPAPDDANSNSAYPLRIRLGQIANDTVISYKGRPVGLISEMDLELVATNTPTHATMKLRLTFWKAPPKELFDELIDMGIEIIEDYTEPA